MKKKLSDMIDNISEEMFKAMVVGELVILSVKVIKKVTKDKETNRK